MYGSKHRTTDGLYENRKDASGYPSSKRDWTLSTEDPSNHRKYIRTQSSSNTRTVPSSSQPQQRQNGDKEKKTAKDTKKPLRVSGDWSEFRSSTGKTYFYNAKTEISQWEKPKGWPSDNSSSTTRPTSTTDRSKKETLPNHNYSSSSATIRPRHKMDESMPSVKSKDSSLPRSLAEQHNGHPPCETSNYHPQDSLASTEPLPSTSHPRLPTPDDDSSRMSFSSTSSKESNALERQNGAVLHSSFSEPAITVSTPVSDNEKHPTLFCSMDIESVASSISKAERDQEIQKYYRADLIQHLTDWSSTQLEKQCLKLFDDYYGYSAKMSTTMTELKALKSNFRVVDIKRIISQQRLLRCQQHLQARDNETNQPFVR